MPADVSLRHGPVNPVSDGLLSNELSMKYPSGLRHARERLRRGGAGDALFLASLVLGRKTLIGSFWSGGFGSSDRAPGPSLEQGGLEWCLTAGEGAGDVGVDGFGWYQPC